MKADAQRHRAGSAFNVRRTLFIPGRIALGIGKGLPIPVNRMPEPGLPVDFIPQVLHHGQFYFHKGRVVAVIPMTHHTGCLQMGTFKRIVFPTIDRNAVDAEESGARQGIRYIRSHKKRLPVFSGSIFFFISVVDNKEIAFLHAGIRFLFCCKTRRRQDFHPRFCRVQVLVHQMQVPGILIGYFGSKPHHHFPCRFGFYCF